MKLATIIAVAIMLTGFGALEFGAIYLSNSIANAMDNSANQIAAARMN